MIVNNYILENLIGEGSYGKVYMGYQNSKENCKIALKKINLNNINHFDKKM